MTMNPTKLIHLNYPELDGGQLPPHQAEGIAFMAMNTHTLCGDPVGAGKTVQAAGLIAHLVEVGDVTPSRPVLWLTEGTTLAEQTARELVRFLPNLTVRNLAGHRDLSSQASEPRKRAVIDEPAHVKIMTFAQWNVRRQLWEAAPPVVILDEVSALKGGGKQHAAVLEVTSAAERVHAFTATVYENNPVEVWHVYALLGLTGLPDRTTFDREYVDWREYDNRRTAHAWASPAAAARFRLITAAHYMCREDCVTSLARPEYVRNDRLVALSAAQARAMTSADRLDGLKRQKRQEDVVTGRLSGPSTRALETGQLIARLVRADPTAKILVIGESIDELDCIAGQLTGLRIGFLNMRGETAKDSRPGVIEDFRTDHNVNVLIGSRVVERGLNLQFCRHLVSVGLPDNPARLDQGIGRVVRHGAPHQQVDHWVILNDHEVDRRALSRLDRKREQSQLLRAQTS